MQYTGLKDTNGREIFEGDILKHYESIFVIEFERGSFVGNSYIDVFGHKAIDAYVDLCDVDFEAEVIGNIYENPELLEVN